MIESIIKVEGIAKRYRVGVQRKKADTFAGQLVDLVSYPFRNFREISRLTRFDQENDPSIFWALRDINFEVRQGEVLGIIGHNGAGKSTLLKILSRITEPTSGQVEIKGRVSSLLEVGTGFHPELSGRDNVYMNGTILGMRKKEIDAKFDEIVAFSGVERHIDTPVKFYSSGMTVRLAFSVAAHLEPEILIIDEVLAVGDAEFQKKCLGKMEDVAGQGRTVLFVSHNMGAVKTLCNRGILLNRGQVKMDGEIDLIVDEYLNLGLGNDGYPKKVWITDEHRGIQYSREIDFDSIELINGETGNRLATDEPIIIDIKFKVNRSIDKRLRLGGTILSADNQPVGTFFTEPQLVARGDKLNAILTIKDHHLAKGHYYLSMSIGTGNEQEGRHECDVVKQTLKFEILYVNGAKKLIYTDWNNAWGKVLYNNITVNQTL